MSGASSKGVDRVSGRTAMAGTALLALLGLVALSAWVAGKTTPTAFDLAVDRLIQPGAREQAVLKRFVELANPLLMLVGCALLAALATARHRFGSALMSLLAPTAAMLLTELLLKPVVGRVWSSSGEHEFPSGHATAAAGFGLVVLLALAPGGALEGLVTRTASAALALAAVVFVAGVLVGLVGLRFHHGTDVLGGLAVSTAAVLGAAAAARLPTTPQARIRTDPVQSCISRGPARST